MIETAPASGYASAKRDRKRAEILAVATEEMNEHGVQGLILSDVAARVGMTKANLTYYFRRKEELAALCFDRTLRIYEGLIAEAGGRATARDRFLALFEGFFAHAARVTAGDEPPLANLGGLMALDEPYGAEALRHYTGLLRAAAALFEEPGGKPVDRIGRLIRAQLILTQLFWSAAWIGHCDPGDYPRIARRMYDLVAGGLALPGATGAAGGLVRPASDADGQRAAFYQAATRLINRFGYRGASVDRIGAAVNVTKGSVYHHHQSKEEVVLACSERSFATMWSIIRGVEARGGDPWARLDALVRSLIAFQVGERGPFLRAAALSALPVSLRESVLTQWARVIHHIAGLVSDGVVEGVVRPVDPYLAAQVIAASINAAEEINRFPPVAHGGDAAALCGDPTLFGVFADSPGSPA